MSWLYRSFVDPPIFWTMVTSLATIVLVIVAWVQLSGLKNTSRADFMYRMRQDFFTPETRRLVFLVQYNLLEFCRDEIPHFRIKDGGSSDARFADLGITQHAISTFDLDDLLLGQLEDLAVFKARRLTSLEDTYEFFSYYVQICSENEAIQEYIRYAREQPGGSDIYAGFLKLADDLKTYGAKKRSPDSR